MERSIFISSKNREPNGDAHSFKVKFYPVLYLDRNMKHSLAVARISMTYSWYNIDPKFGNNTFKFSLDNGNNWSTYTITPGIYSFNDLKEIFENLIPNRTIIRIFFSDSDFYIFLTIVTNCQLDFRNTKFGDLLGFDEKIITTSEEGSRFPNITRDIDTIHICTNKVRNDSLVDGKIGDTLFTFSTNVLTRGFPFEKQPFHLSFVPVSDHYFNEIDIQVKDDKGELVDLNGLDWSMTLVLKSV